MPDTTTAGVALSQCIPYGKAQRKSGMSRNGFRKLVRERGLWTHRLSERVLLLRLDEVEALLGHAPADAPTA
jgi:hypothetical protein